MSKISLKEHNKVIDKYNQLLKENHKLTDDYNRLIDAAKTMSLGYENKKNDFDQLSKDHAAMYIDYLNVKQQLGNITGKKEVLINNDKYINNSIVSNINSQLSFDLERRKFNDGIKL